MRKHYLPKGDDARLSWLANFSSKIGTYSAALGISAAEVTAIATYYAMLLYIMNLLGAIRTFSQEVTQFKDKLMFSFIGSTLGPVPAITIAVPPPDVPAGIFTLISGIVQRIKASINYTEAMGEDLGIIGADIIDDFATAKPVLKTSLDVNHPKIKYNKNRTDGINLYGDHDDGSGMVFMRFITKTTYVDPTELAAEKNSAVWKYKGIYVVEDTEVGIESDEATITVKKKL
jgi:hypothetical protein